MAKKILRYYGTFFKVFLPTLLVCLTLITLPAYFIWPEGVFTLTMCSISFSLGVGLTILINTDYS